MSDEKKFPLKKILKISLRLIILIFVSLCLLLFFLQNKMIFFPSRYPPQATPASLNYEYEELMLDSNQHQINAWYVQSRLDKGNVLFCHGNAGNIGHRLSTIQFWHKLGYNIMIFDYAGYGSSSGSPNEINSYADVEACYTWLTEKKGIDKSAIIAHGRSLGGAMATYIALEKDLDKLILESTFTSVPDMAHHRFPFLPTSILCRTKFPTLERIKNFKGKLLVLHSPDDEVIPYPMGVTLAQEAKIELIQLSGGHNTSHTNNSEYIQAFQNFTEDGI